MTRMNNTRNGYIRVTTKVVQFGDKFREVRLTWCRGGIVYGSKVVKYGSAMQEEKEEEKIKKKTALFVRTNREMRMKISKSQTI